MAAEINATNVSTIKITLSPFRAVFSLETLVAEPRRRLSPPVVDAADRDFAGQQGLERTSIPTDGVGHQGVLRGCQASLDALDPVRHTEFLDPIDQDRFTEPGQGFRKSFLPKRIFQGERHDDALVQASGNVADSRA